MDLLFISGHHTGELWQEQHHVGDVGDHGEHDQHDDDRPPDLPNDILERRAGYARGDEQAHAERRRGQTDHHVEADDEAEMDDVDAHRLRDRP